MPNISISYRYRDSANYKNHSTLVFANPDNISIEEVRDSVTALLIDGEYFYHEAFGVPALYFNGECREEDPTWHELVAIDQTSDGPTEAYSIKAFLQQKNS